MSWDALRETFDWARAGEDELHPFPDGGINLFHEAVGHHVAEGRGAQRALRWLGKRGEEPGSCLVYPVAVRFDEVTYICRLGPLWNDHFDASAWKYLDRQPLCTAAFTYGKARHEVGLVCF